MTRPVLPDPIEVRYGYHFQDLRTGTPQGRLPLLGVRDSITLGGSAGALTGKINVSDPAIRALKPWQIAVPRRTAMFVRRVEVYPPNTLPPRETVDWGGIVWDLNPLAGTGHLEIKAATPESYFASRYVDVDRNYPQTEQTTIHADLLTYFQGYKPGADIRVQATPIATGRLRNRSYLAKDRKEIATLLSQLSEVIDGFDWWIQPYRNPATGLFGFRVQYGYPRLGRTASSPAGPLRLRHLTAGGGNVVEPPTVLRQGTVVKNEGLGLGKSEGDDQVTVTVTGADLGRDEIAAGYPLLQFTRSDTDVSDPTTLRDNVATQMRKGWASEVVLTKVALAGTSRPTRADVNLGDDVSLYTDDATWPAPVTLTGRVWAIETTRANANTAEKVELTLAGEGLTV